MEGGEFEKKTGDGSSGGASAHRRGGSKAGQSVELSNVGPAKAAPAMAYEPPIDKPLGIPVVELQDVSKSYPLEGGGTVTALKSVTLHSSSGFYPIRRGEFVMIRGPSGGGKTTLLNMIGTIDRPTSGELKLFGDIINNHASDGFLASLRLQRIGFVFQTFNLLATLSAFENVELPMSILETLNKKQRSARAKRLLTDVGLQDRMGHLPSELSGGEQQRVTIARALSNNPDLLLLDEPTGDLDTKNTVDIMDLLLSINQNQRITCVMVTHNPDLECYADRILYVSDGKFQSQAINTHQERLDYEKYSKYLNTAADDLADATQAAAAVDRTMHAQ